MNQFKLFMTIQIVIGIALSFLIANTGISWAAEAKTQRDVATVHKNHQSKRITQAQREAAAKRAAKIRAAVPEHIKNNIAKNTMDMPMPEPGTVPHYFGPEANWAFSPPLRKFVDTLPLLTASGANNLGQYLPVAVPDTITYPGSDYYEISIRQYQEKMHSDLMPTTLRGYVQTNNGTDMLGMNSIAPSPIHYLGPVIIAQKNRPVRMKITNELPTGNAGKLFIPVDTTVMGAGMGPKDMEFYTQNRTSTHLHGGKTPWISDGTPHQWVTPAGEMTSYHKGASLQNVPDMPDPGEGATTLFYTNQQSARFMFYHDHAYGITRLNVYVGMAAGYVISDPTEQDLVARGIIPEEQIPLIIQDKTFVDPTTIMMTDPTWNWGVMPGNPMKGDLWLPHVYVPAQNPYDESGVNATGRWAYGPWFWPPTEDIKYPPVENPYYDPMNAPAEPPYMPGVPHPSMGMEAFSDTAIVNGTAFPSLTVDPKAYRFRILNAANDRFWNLSMYVTDPTIISSDGRTDTEIAMVPAVPTPGFPEKWPIDSREGGVPDPATVGPEWIQIGTEGGFLPAPVVIPNQPIDWNVDATTFDAGNVNTHSLLLGCAERADVIVDFSQFRGKTIILYNDAPAAFPAYDPRYDYYAGAPDYTETGGHSGPQAGFGPNTRTIMQIKVNDIDPAPAFDMDLLNTEWTSTPSTPGVFARSQDPIIVAQPAYNSIYNSEFPTQWPDWGLVRIQDKEFSFKTINGNSLTIPLQPKAIQDEMGETFDFEYGRMAGKLGLELPRTIATNQNLTLYAYMDVPTEDLNDSMTPMTPVLGDGTQIWKITHNGVDTHPIHFHLTDVQLLNRVGWDGAIRKPEPNELGWKETVRVSPLEDTIVALRPTAPRQPFGIPDSIRMLDPTMPEGSTMGFSPIDPVTGQPRTTPVVNKLFNFGWEYMWHCHILSHEEMDMMRPIVFNVARSLADAPVLSASLNGLSDAAILNWTDGTPPALASTWGNPANEIGYRIDRATGLEDEFEPLSTALANQTIFTDETIEIGQNYRYRVTAFNAAGDSVSNVNSVGPNSRPDLWLRNLSDAAYMGDNIYSDDGATQIRSQSIVRGGSGMYYLRIQNDAISADIFSLKAPMAPAGWTVRYYQLSDNAEVTEAVTGGSGWSTGVVAAGANAGLSVKVMPAKSLTLGSKLTLTLTATSAWDGLKKDVGRLVTTATGYLPDLWVRAFGDTGYLGDNIYTTNGATQIRSLSVMQGANGYYYLRVQNDGSVNDTFTVKAPIAPAGWNVQYRTFSGVVVTPLVTGASGWSTGVLAKNAISEGLIVIVTPSITTPIGEKMTVMPTVTSNSSNTNIDVGRLVTTATGWQPDLWVRAYGDEGYLGDNIYSADGATQTRSLSATAGSNAFYYLRLQNDGSALDSFTIKSATAPAGWNVQYKSFAGMDVTSLVTGATGWTSELLASMAISDGLIVIVTPNDSQLVGDSLTLTITTASSMNGAKKDVGKLITTIETNADDVIAWNDTALQAVAAQQWMPPQVSRGLAMLHGAMYDAVNAVQQRGQKFNADVVAPAGASQEAAVAQAAYRICMQLMPAQSAVFDTKLQASLSNVTDGQAKNDGITLGNAVADAILAWRTNDGSQMMAGPPFMGSIDPGQWRPTPPGYMPGVFVGWRNVIPFAMTSANQFRPIPPPALDSAEYAADYNEVYALGAKTSAIRTPEQSMIANFWVGMPGSVTEVGRMNQVTQQATVARNLSLYDSARLFTLVNVAIADSAIAGIECKYFYNAWRPITAIQEGATDNNPATTADVAWLPYLDTPAHPEYISTHSALTKAAATVLERFFKTDKTSLDLPAFMDPNIKRHYTSFSAVADEAGMSRLYGGIHFRFAFTNGNQLGKNIGDYVFDYTMQPN